MKIKLFITMLLLVLFASCSSEEHVIGFKQELQHDDYFYSITDYYKTPEIAGRKAKGMFYVVTFKVENKAKRVDHPWDNNIAYIIDENVMETRNDPELQALLNTVKPFNLKDVHKTKAGETETTVFVFDVPAGIKQPFLKYKGEFLMGDMFDGNNFKRTKVKLF